MAVIRDLRQQPARVGHATVKIALRYVSTANHPSCNFLRCSHVQVLVKALVMHMLHSLPSQLLAWHMHTTPLMSSFNRIFTSPEDLAVVTACPASCF
jgi:hypothetical protein